MDAQPIVDHFPEGDGDLAHSNASGRVGAFNGGDAGLYERQRREVPQGYKPPPVVRHAATAERPALGAITAHAQQETVSSVSKNSGRFSVAL
jgi:hypothetical protein